jgi:hypothetical protein
MVHFKPIIQSPGEYIFCKRGQAIHVYQLNLHCDHIREDLDTDDAVTCEH